jgi:hypothetical protein
MWAVNEDRNHQAKQKTKRKRMHIQGIVGVVDLE